MSSPPHEPDGAVALSPDEAFALLGNDTRVGILRALWDAFDSGWSDDSLPFSELYDRVDIADSGNFSYHLEKLTGHFVRKTDEGYELTQTGLDVVRAVVAGTVTDTPTLGPTEVNVACPRCDGTVEVTYVDDSLRCRCTECDGIRHHDGEPGYVLVFPLPPVGLQHYGADEALRATITYNFHQAAAMLDGVCPVCSSHTESSVDVCTDHEPGGEEGCPNCEQPWMATVLLSCPTCKRWFFFPVGGAVLSHPRVAAFYHDNGIEHRFATWESYVRSHDVHVELRSKEPLRLGVTIPAGDQELRLTLDDALDVLDAAR